MRKLVKDMLYNAKFAEENWEAAFLKIKKMPLGELDKLSDKLGAYNDARIMLDHFSSFSAATMYKEERDTLNLFCAKEKIALESNKKLLLTQIRRFVKTMSVHTT